MENNIILYSNQNGNVNISVTYQNDTFWLPQKAIAQLFGVEVLAIRKHLANIYDTSELKNRQPFPFWKQFSKKEQEK